MISEQDREEINNYYQSIFSELIKKVDRPNVVLEEIISWTYFNRYFTRTIFEFILELSESDIPIPIGQEKKRIENLVQTRLIKNWEFQKASTYLTDIQNAIINTKESTNLLKLYQRILQQDDLSIDDSPEQEQNELLNHLMDSGLIIIKEGKWRVTNRIYEQIFNQKWISEKLNIHLPSLKNPGDTDEPSEISRVFAYLSIVILVISFLVFLLLLVLKNNNIVKNNNNITVSPSSKECHQLNDEIDEIKEARLNNKIDEARRNREKAYNTIQKGLFWKKRTKATLNNLCFNWNREYNISPINIDNKFDNLLHQIAQDKIDINHLEEAVDLLCNISDKYEDLATITIILNGWKSTQKDKIKAKINNSSNDCPALSRR